MQNLLKPKWIFIINTLPISVLLFIFFGQFQIVKSLLEEENINLWKSFGLALLILGILNLLYGIYLTVKKEKISVFFGVISSICHIVFLYLFSDYASKIIPFSIPRWMIQDDLFLYVGTFLMPTIAYSFFILVVHFTSKNKEYKAWKNFLIAISIPIACYVFSQVILPLWKPVTRNYNEHVIIIFVIVGTLIFLFFLARGIYILASKKNHLWKDYQLAWKIPISIILPIIGLLVNNGTLSNSISFGESGFFGDFSSHWFYIITIINGIFICLPNRDNQSYRLALFIGRSITFTFTLYFFIVFLPFLPFSLIATIIVGTGFLMLAPLLLFIIHLNELVNDYSYLNSVISKNTVLISLVASLLVLPTVLTITYSNDKRTLHKGLEYVFSPDYTKEYNIDKTSLRKTLNVVKSHKSNNRGGIFGTQQPYLSSYFNWLVLDNLTISETKINSLERVFFGEAKRESSNEVIRNNNVKLTDINVESEYDTTQKAWKSWVNFEITNNSNNRLAEYATTINLPEGTWISDYYLYVGDRKEKGILAEKKTAMWVFSNIRNENKDPGILYYLTGNDVAFRVFPFAENEVRKTGVQLLHKEPIKLEIDNNIINLGTSNDLENYSYETKNVSYVSSKEKQNLKEVKRKPYFHFIVDATDENNVSDYIEKIDKLLLKNSELSNNAKVSFVNTYVSTASINSDWKSQFKNQEFQGGFYIDRAIKKVLIDSYKSETDSYPVIVTVTDYLGNAIFNKDFSNLKFCYPESNYFYNLNIDNSLEAHSLIEFPTIKVKDSINNSFDYSVLEYKQEDNSVSYLPNNDKPSILLKNELFDITENEIKDRNWDTALTMHAKWVSNIIHPERTNTEWLKLVKYSFLSKIMSPVTSYLVVENEAQKAILKKKQEQVLSSKKYLDLGEDTQRMSEPSLIILGLLLLLILLYKKKFSN